MKDEEIQMSDKPKRHDSEDSDSEIPIRPDTGPAVVGSTVVLNSGGLSMTVTQIIEPNLTAIGTSPEGAVAQVTAPRECFRIYKK